MALGAASAQGSFVVTDSYERSKIGLLRPRCRRSARDWVSSFKNDGKALLLVSYHH